MKTDSEVAVDPKTSLKVKVLDRVGELLSRFADKLDEDKASELLVLIESSFSQAFKP